MASPTHSTSTSPSRKAPDSGAKDLKKLRSILFAPEQSQIENIKEKIEGLAVDEKTVGRVLPHAILLRSKQDQQLAKSLSPLIEDGFIHSLEKSPQKVAAAISPIIAPAIRKAILHALRGMVQSLNQTLEHSISWKGLQWRIEALRTGKSFAEIVLLHTLRFRVEQVFLIHRETGLLLQHVAAEVETIQDEEIVSGMLTAIQDFVRDSFGGTQSDSLESFRVGELTIWVEQGSKAILAGVVRGSPPLELHEVFQQVLETIQIEFPDEFHAVSGDQRQFERTRPYLEDCLQAQFEGRSSQASPFLMALIILLGISLLTWGIWTYLDHQQWRTFFLQAEREPGIIVTSIDESNGTLIVNGLRDPLSVEPTDLAVEAGLDTESIQFHLEPYFSVSSHFLEMRTRSRLQPPESVSLSVENTTLVVTGEASHQWVTQLRSLRHIVPGLTNIDTKHLIDTDVVQFDALRRTIEEHHFFFEKGRTWLSEASKDRALAMTRHLQDLDILAERLRQTVHVELRGQSSQEGSQLRNKHLRIARANAVLNALSVEGLKSTRIEPVEFRGRALDHVSLDHAAMRQVSIKVISETEIEGGKGLRE